ncbi:MAG TPA: cytochrome P450 [Archangium sp.]|uniref:cytochrome P450 n=1 Tax=Archangium sp. TaxID=1872627 RepID=UPI002E3653C2|nr:cytochrome P450 [Archangium sp.]HEX5752115.1 cytochrome P450 [Archangium sp.]
MIDYDPLSAQQLENPYAVYAAARAHQPVFFSARTGMWIVTRYEDISTVLKDPVRFSSVSSIQVAKEFAPEVLAVLAEGVPPAAGLVDSDPPAHTRLRGLVSRAFTPRRMASMEPRIRQIAHELVDAFIQQGQADLVWRLAYPLPAWVIADILGLPRQDMEDCKRWGDEMMALFGGAHLPVEQQAALARGQVRLTRYLLAHVEERQAQPREDLLSALVHARLEDGSALSPSELVSVIIQLLNAGHETTTNLITAALVLLLEHPEQLRAVREDGSLLQPFVEETLRLESPVQGLFRITTEQVELGGVTLPRGARLQVLYASGSRDEAVFPRPERLELNRPNAESHLAFGRGIHFCLGAALARLTTVGLPKQIENRRAGRGQ